MADKNDEEFFGPPDKVRKRKKKRNIIQRFLKSKPGEYFVLKFPFGAALGAALGYGYYKFLFDGAFQKNEHLLEFLVFWILIAMTTFGCAISVQCRCVGILCLPSMVGKTGRAVLKAILTSLILAGPVANIISNIGVSIHSITCVAQIHNRQMKEMFLMLHAPITQGLQQISNDTTFANDTELVLKLNLQLMKAKLWSKPKKPLDIKTPGDAVETLKSSAEHLRRNTREAADKESSPGRGAKEIVGNVKVSKLLQNHGTIREIVKRAKNVMKNVKDRKSNYSDRTKKRSLFFNVGKTRKPRKIKRNANRNAKVEAYLEKLKQVEFQEPENPAKKLRDDAFSRCYKLFEISVDECKRLMRKKELECRRAIGIPFIGWLLCLPFKARFVCNVVQWFDSWCNDIPKVDEKKLNRLYYSLDESEKKLDDEFKTTMMWKIPIERDEEAVVLTVDEVTDRIESDLNLKSRYFQFFLSLIKKFVAISFLFVVNAARKYNKDYLTDFRFDNIYITSYFKRKDRERMLQGKRSLLPLTRMEKRTVISARSIKLTEAEGKSTLFRLIKITGEAVFATVVFFFDYVVFYILDLVRRHARMEMSITGKHVLEVHVEGEGMIAQLLRRLFFTFEDNEHSVNKTISNLECLPQPHRLPRKTTINIVTYFLAFYVIIFLEAYALRLRHVIAGIAYRRREKKRVIFLYSDLMRRRKNHLEVVRLTVKKLARKYHLKQRYSFMQAFTLSYPRCGFCCKIFGVGATRCLICKHKETKRNKHVTCRNGACHVTFCSHCWKEVGKRCWACGDDNKQHFPDNDVIEGQSGDVEDNISDDAFKKKRKFK